MTNEEAIKNLKKLKSFHNGSYGTAIDLAIKALETASCIKEKCAYCPHCERCDVDDDTLAIKALEQQPCEDTISRTEALKHSHIEYDDDGEGHRLIYVEDIEDLPSVTPKEG